MKVLVYGFYHKNNVGDDLFIEAFRKIFPELDLLFVNNITSDLLNGTAAVFIGGGSFLYAEPKITESAFELLKKKKVFYISVGGETSIHPKHIELMKMAELVAIRNKEHLDKIATINPSTICIPDIVYALSQPSNAYKNKKLVLVMPNLSVVPRWSDDHWAHAAWSYFKTEFAQFLDYLIDNKYEVKFFPMSVASNMDDSQAAAEIVAHMNHRSNKLLLPTTNNISSLLSLLSSCSTVVTQRFHGIILSEIARTPYVAIHHHDKLKSSFLNEGKFISYYGISKQELINSFHETNKLEITSILPIESNIFEDLKERVMNSIGG